MRYQTEKNDQNEQTDQISQVAKQRQHAAKLRSQLRRPVRQRGLKFWQFAQIDLFGSSLIDDRDGVSIRGRN